MTKGTITKWYKKEGEAFIAGDLLCDVETDKATVGFEMVDSGVLAKIIMPTGSKDVPLGAPVAVVVDDAKDVGSFKDFTPELKAKKEAPKVAEPKKAEPKKAAPEPEKKVEKKEVPKPEPKIQKQFIPPTDVMISPAARKIAADLHIDLGMVQGSGRRGLITKDYIINFLENGPKPSVQGKGKVPVMTGPPEFEDIQLTNYKRVAAERLLLSKQTVPHFYVSIECEMDQMLGLREKLNKYSKSKISINDMLVKALAMASLKVPDANSAWMGTFIRRYKDVDVCVAVQTPKGLIAPVVSRVNKKGLEEIAMDTKKLIDKAKEGRLKPEEIEGGTITISNAGMYGISQLIPIVNPPQACILGVSQVEKRIEVDSTKEKTNKPWKIVNKMIVSLSCDHRVVDGASASEWTKEFKKLVENPNLMLL
jgi:pyruvate dehydrogenase E2 component (dihydrolipoamide acetyltransferase)